MPDTEKLRAVEEVEQEHDRWRMAQPVVLSESDRVSLLALGTNLPRVWRAPTTTAADRKRILRLIVQEVVLDQTRRTGQISIRIVWQTGATSEHWVRRRVQAYDNHADLDQLEHWVRDLNAAGKTDAEIATALNAAGLLSTRGTVFNHRLVHLLRKRWTIPTVKINGGAENPPRWSDGSYSVQGAAAVLGVTAHTIFAWLNRGWLSGHQLAKGMPWQITLEDEQIPQLRSSVRRHSQSRRKAS